MDEIIEAWHFLRSNRKLRFGKRELVKAGEVLAAPWPYNGYSKPTLCEAGLHASRRAIDALSHAHGNIVCRVLVRGRIVEDKDKLVGDERGVLWMADSESVLREFARWCARSVLHLWDAPQIVKQYLETGDASIRAAARDAAEMAARDAAWAAAWDAWAASRAAARATARAAATVTAAATAAAWAAGREKQNAELTRLLMTLEPK